MSAVAENGEVSNWCSAPITDWNSCTRNIYKTLIPYFKSLALCTSATDSRCGPIRYKNSSGNFANVTWISRILTNNGIEYGTTGGETKVYYSYADGVTLEMMTKDENKELVDVTSGQNIQKLNDKSYNNTLIEMADVLEIGSEWAKDPENEELKEAYIQALEEHKEKEEEKEIETASKTENTNNIKTASMDEEER